MGRTPFHSHQGFSSRKALGIDIHENESGLAKMPSTLLKRRVFRFGNPPEFPSRRPPWDCTESSHNFARSRQRATNQQHWILTVHSGEIHWAGQMDLLFLLYYLYFHSFLVKVDQRPIKLAGQSGQVMETLGAMTTPLPRGFLLIPGGSPAIFRPHLLGCGFSNEVHLYLLQLAHFLITVVLEPECSTGRLLLNSHPKHHCCHWWEEVDSWVS